MEITIKIQGLEGLVTAISQLAGAIGGKKGGGFITPISDSPSVQAPNTQTPVMNQPQVNQGVQMQAPIQQTPVYNSTPQQAPTVQQSFNQVPTQQPPAQQVPTSHTAQSYSQDQLAVTMTALCDAGKYDVVMGILGQFGAESLMQIPKEQYANLATMLRGAGGNI